MSTIPVERNRSFTSVFGVNHATPSFQYLWDPSLLTTGGTNTSITGGWRGVEPADFSNVTITGAQISIGAVAITGSPNVRVINPLAITGSPNVTLVGTGTITGNVTPISYGYTTTVASIVGTGQVLVPVGAKAWSVSVISGAIWVKGIGPLLPGASLGGGGFDGRGSMVDPIAIGGTGAGASSVNALVVYDA